MAALSRFEKLRKLLEIGYYDGQEEYVDKMISLYLKANVINPDQAEELRMLNRPEDVLADEEEK